MYARISTWRARPEDFEALSREIAPVIAEVQRQPGYVAGYEVQIAPDTRTIVSIWQDEERMRTGTDQIGAVARRLMESGRLELVEAKGGPAELWS